MLWGMIRWGCPCVAQKPASNRSKNPAGNPVTFLDPDAKPSLANLPSSMKSAAPDLEKMHGVYPNSGKIEPGKHTWQERCSSGGERQLPRLGERGGVRFEEPG